MVASKICAAGYYVPEHTVSNDQLSEYVETSDEWIYSRTGIRYRRMSGGENTSQLAAKAAKRILEAAGADPLSVELIIVATISGDYATPSTACLVQAEIGAKNAVAFDLGAACSGFVFALSVADKYIQSGLFQNALVIGAEVMTKTLDFQDRSTCVLFGDGAGGVFLRRGNTGGVLAEDLGSDGMSAQSLLVRHFPVNNLCTQQSCKQPFLSMDGKAIFQFAVRETPKSISRLMDKTTLTYDEIHCIIPHQANSRIIDGIARKLHLPADKFYCNMYDYGNTSSASIPIALGQLWEQGALTEGVRVIIAGFGAGLTWGSLLLEF